MVRMLSNRPGVLSKSQKANEETQSKKHDNSKLQELLSDDQPYVIYKLNHDEVSWHTPAYCVPSLDPHLGDVIGSALRNAQQKRENERVGEVTRVSNTHVQDENTPPKIESGSGHSATADSPPDTSTNRSGLQRLPRLSSRLRGDSLRPSQVRSGLIPIMQPEVGTLDHLYVETAPMPSHHTKMASFRIRDTKKVIAFYFTKMDQIQQVANKKIAKAWIKAICPRKQAKYPYTDKNREAKGQKAIVPPWWPSTDVCRFAEPDHICKEERIALIVHLLCLRPSSEELKAWNNKAETKPDEFFVPSLTHERQGWTAFLKEQAPVRIMEEFPAADREHTEMRKKDLEQLYKVADMQEHFVKYGVGGDDQYQYPDEPRSKPPKTRKRVRLDDRPIETADKDHNDNLSPPSSPPVSRDRTKRIRSSQPTTRKAKRRMAPESTMLVDEKPSSHHPMTFDPKYETTAQLPAADRSAEATFVPQSIYNYQGPIQQWCPMEDSYSEAPYAVQAPPSHPDWRPSELPHTYPVASVSTAGSRPHDMHRLDTFTQTPSQTHPGGFSEVGNYTYMPTHPMAQPQMLASETAQSSFTSPSSMSAYSPVEWVQSFGDMSTASTTINSPASSVPTHPESFHMVPSGHHYNTSVYDTSADGALLTYMPTPYNTEPHDMHVDSHLASHYLPPASVAPTEANFSFQA